MDIKDGIKQENDELHAFLMIGQSNMAGRGEFGDVEPINNKLCHMLRMGRWQKMADPVNPDRPIFEGAFHSGISLASSFADAYAKENQVKTGLIPCADGGTAIGQWMPGEILYDHAVMQCKLAQRTSVIKGILWHQGETDCKNDERVAAYKQKFITMMTALRRDLGDETLPIIIGELSEQIAPKWERGDRPVKLNRVFAEIAAELPYCAVAPSGGLSMKPDGIHFDAVSCREFGKRYFKAYCSLMGS